MMCCDVQQLYDNAVRGTLRLSTDQCSIFIGAGMSIPVDLVPAGPPQECAPRNDDSNASKVLHANSVNK